MCNSKLLDDLGEGLGGDVVFLLFVAQGVERNELVAAVTDSALGPGLVAVANGDGSLRLDVARRARRSKVAET